MLAVVVGGGVGVGVGVANSIIRQIVVPDPDAAPGKARARGRGRGRAAGVPGGRGAPVAGRRSSGSSDSSSLYTPVGPGSSSD